MLIGTVLCEYKYLLLYNGTLQVRFGVFYPESSAIVGDIVYQHGLASRLDNHLQLYASWQKAGFRVIAYDVPQHGENKGSANNLNSYTFEDLSFIFSQVELHTREDPSRPLLISGWSIGGLLVSRMVQSSYMQKIQGRNITAAIAFTPDIAVHLIIGDKGFFTIPTLTSFKDPKLAGPLKPNFPAWDFPLFAVRLIDTAYVSYHHNVTLSIPFLSFVAGKDVYADTPSVLDYLHKQKSYGANLQGVVCDKAKHWMDYEYEPLGSTVRTTAAEFALWSIQHKSISQWVPQHLGTECQLLD
jgi:hypothetical protein